MTDKNKINKSHKTGFNYIPEREGFYIIDRWGGRKCTFVANLWLLVRLDVSKIHWFVCFLSHVFAQISEGCFTVCTVIKLYPKRWTYLQSIRWRQHSKVFKLRIQFVKCKFLLQLKLLLTRFGKFCCLTC